ncbi:hypothetical protein LTR53_016301 [Teratosphaeriaceae sp. CCFEE 6253]|nr:hypothetical protein LTR53_016301 [Teratosphaeriaceae sp. CCFEE 6253]
MAHSGVRDQARDAQQLYDDRAISYDDSWHPRFARHMTELADLQPGEDVLDLACGTGLATFPASIAVGESGTVIGVDISPGMLAQCESKRRAHALSNVTIYQHSITDLGSLPGLDGKLFDVIICASALVLLQDPGDALRQWVTFLKPGGRLVTDVTHPASQISLIAFERVGRALGRPLPFYRVPFQRPEDLRILMEEAGLRDVETILLSQTDIDGTDALAAYRSELEHPRVIKKFSVTDADRKFDEHIGSGPAETIAGPDIVDQARKLFAVEWAKLADASGVIEVVDGVFISIGRSPETSLPCAAIFTAYWDCQVMPINRGPRIVVYRVQIRRTVPEVGIALETRAQVFGDGWVVELVGVHQVDEAQCYAFEDVRRGGGFGAFASHGRGLCWCCA